MSQNAPFTIDQSTGIVTAKECASLPDNVAATASVSVTFTGQRVSDVFEIDVGSFKALELSASPYPDPPYPKRGTVKLDTLHLVECTRYYQEAQLNVDMTVEYGAGRKIDTEPLDTRH